MYQARGFHTSCLLLDVSGGTATAHYPDKLAAFMEKGGGEILSDQARGRNRVRGSAQLSSLQASPGALQGADLEYRLSSSTGEVPGRGSQDFSTSESSPAKLTGFLTMDPGAISRERKRSRGGGGGGGDQATKPTDL